MDGAREYAGLFKTGQYGRLYITSSRHARGKTFHIQVLPEGVAAIPNGSINICLNTDAVEVYGITGGQPGWTETYGWLHRGPWVGDFEAMCERRRAEIAERKREAAMSELERDIQKAQKQQALLATYATGSAT